MTLRDQLVRHETFTGAAYQDFTELCLKGHADQPKITWTQSYDKGDSTASTLLDGQKEKKG
jgi:hypothetical protein